MTIDTARCETCNGLKIVYGYGGAKKAPCPDCTEPAPSAGVSEKRLKDLLVHFQVCAKLDPLSSTYADSRSICRELLSARSRIAELSRQLEQAEAVRSDEAFSGALSDELYKKRIAELEAGIRKWASECAECAGKGYVYEGEYITGRGPDDVFPEKVACDQCADIRALLPKESDTQGKRDE